MTLHDFAMMQLISQPAAQELLNALAIVGQGERSVSAYDPATGFCLKVQTLDGAPVQWFIQGPLTADQARRALPRMGWQDVEAVAARSH